MNPKKQKLIRTLNRFFKTDITYLIHGVGWLGSTKLLSSVFSFVLVIAFANLLPAETYGTYSYVMAAVSIIVLTSLPGIESSLLRSVARGFGGSLFTAQRVRLRWSSIGVTILLLMSGYYFYQENMILSSSFIVGGLLFPLFVSFSQFGSYLNGSKLFRELALHQLTVKFLFAVTLGVALLFTDNVATLVALNMGIIAFTGILFTRQVIAKHQDELKTPPDENLISYGKHLTVMNILETIGSYLDKILLWHFLGPVQVAIWALAYTPIQIAQSTVKKTLIPLAQPKFAQNDFKQTKQQLPTKVAKLFLMLVPAAICYVLVAPFLFKYAFSQYTDSVIYSQALTLLLLLIPFNFFSGFLVAHARKRDLYIIKVSFGLTLIISLLIFIPLWGLWGAVVAHVTAMIIRSTLSLTLFLKA
jgi:O-antigen/teichoic acid export membrane protein